MAHAIHGYRGACKNIHGHSYELHVSVGSSKIYEGYFTAPGFVIDFKELKKTVTSAGKYPSYILFEPTLTCSS